MKVYPVSRAGVVRQTPHIYCGYCGEKLVRTEDRMQNIANKYNRTTGELQVNYVLTCPNWGKKSITSRWADTDHDYNISD